MNVGDVYDDFGHEWTITAVRSKGKEIDVVHMTPDAFGKMGPSAYRTFHPRDFAHMPKVRSAPTKPSRKHRSKGKHRAGRRTAKAQALRDVEAASIRYVRAGKMQSSASGGPGADPRYERALQAAWKARATGTEIQAAMARGEARAGRHKARGRHR